MTGYPPALPLANQTAPAPRRIRAVLNGHTVLDTTSALYVWEWPRYPQYYIPATDIDAAVLVDEQREQKLKRGTARLHGLRVASTEKPSSVRIYGKDSLPGLAGMARLEWDAVDAWFEEDEQIFVHPRDPYVRVDALRSTRHITVELDGVLLAESTSPVLLFETALPTRYYLNRLDVDLAQLEPVSTVSSCPYKGTTSSYWTARIGAAAYPDIAWAYDFPTRQLLPIAGLVAFYNEKVDITLDGEPQPRPVTHFS